MRLSAVSLRVAAGASTVGLCALSGVVVAADTKPVAAPLKPPVGTTQSVTPSLAIPATQLCQKGPGNAAPGPAAAPLPSLDAANKALVKQYQAATPAERKQMLAGLTADQRQQVTAYLAAVKARAGAGASRTKGCAPQSSPDGGVIAPTVSDAPSVGPSIANSYVS